MTSSSPRLAAADRLLLRQVFAWGHASGWSYKKTGRDYEFEHPTIGSIDVSDELHRVAVWYWREKGQHNVSFWPESVRETVDVLVALGILPAHLSSVWREAEVEWSARMKDGRPAFASTFTEGGARRYVDEQPELLAVFTRRVGPWERVPDA